MSRREWLGGRFTLPHPVREAGRAFQPQLCLWMELPRRVIVGSAFGETVSLADALESAMLHPQEGAPRRPDRIRVADQATANELRKTAAGIPIFVAPVPEIDEAFAALAEAMAADTPEPSYLGDGDIPPRAIADLFRIAKVLHAVAPWRSMSDAQIIRVDVPTLDIDGACLSVMGAGGESFGLMLFRSLDDYEAFIDPEAPAASASGIAMRSLSLEKKKDLPPSLLREIAEHRWPVAGPKAYPMILCIGADRTPLPPTESDVRILTIVTRAFVAFFGRHTGIFASDNPEPITESSEGDDGIEVVLTAPFVIHEDEEEASENESVHEMDHRLLRAMMRFGATFDRNLLEFDPDEEDEDALMLILPWTVWTAEAAGRKLASLYREKHGDRMSSDERDWVAAQQAAWLSVWEVTSVGPGRIDVRDLLTGETRRVQEERGSTGMVVRDAVLARIADYHGSSYFVGTHSRPLSPAHADTVIRAARARLRLRTKPVSVAHLQTSKMGWFLIDAWSDAVAHASKPPALQNTDGDPLRFVVDSFSFDPAQRQEVLRRMESIENLAGTDDDDDERRFTFLRPSDETVVGQVVVGDGTLRIETNSENRAAALASRVKKAFGPMLRRRKRWAQEPSEIRGRASGEAPLDESPEVRAALRQWKEDHYRRWLETPLPALGGKTPIAAVRVPALRRELDVILRSIENGENRLPEEERFDVRILRRELGME